jgi:hypothetical protein
MRPDPGVLTLDGGEWYATSHVDLSVDANGLKEALNLRIGPEDIPSLRQELGYAQADQSGKDAINRELARLQTRELDIVNDDNRIITRLTQNRILNAYYQFAPIEKVVRNIYMTIYIQGGFRVFGSSIARRKYYADTNAARPSSFRIQIPSRVHGLQEYSKSVLVNMTDGTQVQMLPTSVSDLDQGIIRSQTNRTITFEDRDFNTDFQLEMVANGRRWRQNITLVPLGTPFDPDGLEIRGTDIPQEGESNTYILIARVDDIRSPADVDRVQWSVDSDVARFRGNTLEIDEIFTEQVVDITATYQSVNLGDMIVTKRVTLTPAPKPFWPREVRIIVERMENGVWVELDPLKDVEQGKTDIYLRAEVIYTDGSQVDLQSYRLQVAGVVDAPLGQWELNTRSARLSETQNLTADVVYRDFNIEASVSYEDQGRTVQTQQEIRFKKPRVFIERIEIVGPTEVVEETRHVYQTMAFWTDGVEDPENPGNNRIISQSIVAANWSSSVTANAGIADINENGLMIAPSVDFDSKNVNINARIKTYRYDSEDRELVVTLNTSVSVQVNAVERDIANLDILTPEGLSQGNANIARFYANWNDSSTTQLFPYRIELKRARSGEDEQEPVSKFIRTGVSGTFEHEENNPIILTQLAPDIQNPGRNQFFAAEDGESFQQFAINYLLDSSPDSTLVPYNGLMDLTVFYVNREQLPDDLTDVTLTDADIEFDNQNNRWTYQGRTDVNIVTHTQTISAVPRIFLSESLEIVYPETMPESTRVFLTAIVTYANGESEEANAQWTIEPQFVDQEIEADMTQGTFTVERIVNSLLDISRTWFDNPANQLNQAQIDTLVNGELMFRVMAEDLPASWTDAVRDLIDNMGDRLFPRALLQTRPLEDGVEQQFRVNARFFQQDETVTITSIADPVIAHNIIESARIEGPGEITADTNLFYSYGLVVDYDDQGISYMVSNGWRVEVVNRVDVLNRMIAQNDSFRSLLPTNDRLEIIAPEDLTEEQLDEILIQGLVVDIDTNGYLYPRVNIDAELIIYADYDDEITQFTSEMRVFMQATNSVLTGMYLNNITNDGLFERNSNVTPTDNSDANGIIRLSDVPLLSTPNSSIPTDFDQQTQQGVLFYQFRAMVERTDELGTLYEPPVVDWELDTVSDKISLGRSERNVVRLLVANGGVETDTVVTVRGTYTEEFARETDAVDITDGLNSEDTVETVQASLRVIIESSTAIETITNIGPNFVFDDPDAVFVPVVEITRRDGSVVADPDSMTEWRIVAGPIGLEYVEESRGFRIPPQTQNTTMVLRAIAREGQRTIQEDFEFTILLEFSPQDIQLVLPTPVQNAVIDAQELELRAELTGNTQNGPEVRDISDRAFYYFDYREDDARIVGRNLEVDPIALTKIITVSVRSQEYPTQLREVPITVYSSYPVFGTDDFGVNNNSRFNQSIANGAFQPLTSRTGGTFLLNPEADEYGYFAHPASLGRAIFTFIPQAGSAQSIIGGWDGAGRDSNGNGASTGPITVRRIYQADLDEEWYLYRTNLRGFSEGRFSVRYEQE